MTISRIKLVNWKNFKHIDVKLGKRVFIVGPNASGKSNLLDAFRFLRDIAMPGGGLQKSITDRGGLSLIRCLGARKNPRIEFEVTFESDAASKDVWIYSIGISQEPRGNRRARLDYEKVEHKRKVLLDRPDEDDKKDEERLYQTATDRLL